MPTSLSFSFPLPLIRTGMSTSVATLGCGRGPHLAPRRLLRTHAFQKNVPNRGHFSLAVKVGWAGIGCLAPFSLKSGLPSWMFLTSPGVYFWVLPMPGELLPHWVVIDRASLFWQGWGFSVLVLRLKGHTVLTDWRLWVVWYGNRLVWRRASVGGRMHAARYWSRQNEARRVDVVKWLKCERSFKVFGELLTTCWTMAADGWLYLSKDVDDSRVGQEKEVSNDMHAFIVTPNPSHTATQTL